MNAWTHDSFENYGGEGEGGWEEYTNTADRLIISASYRLIINASCIPTSEGGARKIGVATLCRNAICACVPRLISEIMWA